MIVVDASTAVLGLLNDGDARRILVDETLAVPHLVDAEVVQAVRGQLLRGAITAGDGQKAVATWARLGLQRFSLVGLLERVWDLRDNLSAYDACYVALAESLACALVTADARISRAHGPRCAITVVRG